MALFGRGSDINEEVKTCRDTEGAVLLDVRAKDEFAEAHIPGAVNVPLQELRDIEDVVLDLDTPLFVYCLAGTRSMQAVATLKRMGYTNVRNIGGIAAWNGEIEKGASSVN